MQTRFAFRHPFDAVSRRGALLAGVGLAASFALPPAFAQGAAWRTYRRDDFGFRIDLPAAPAEEDDANPGNGAKRLVTARVRLDGVQYRVMAQEFGEDVNAEEMFAHIVGVYTAHIPGVRLRSVTPLAMRYPAREFVADPDPATSDRPAFITARSIVMGKRVVDSMVISERAIAGDAGAKRFLESFALL